MKAGQDETRALNAKLWARHPEDYYIEPDWLDDAIFAAENFEGPIYDPACGSGRIVRAAARAGYYALGSDIVNRCAECAFTKSFLDCDQFVQNIVSNPPFGIADAFIQHALCHATRKVVMILPAKFTSSDRRSRWLETTPLRRNLDIVPRPSMPPGPVIEAGFKPGGGKENFKVLVWEAGYVGVPESGWLRKPASAKPAGSEAA
jgi:SAM-dependent methyltransferase